jgi:DNA-binding Lrp family transcriptional regulator
MLTAMMLLNTKKGMVSTVARELGSIDEVTEVYSVAGPYDLIAKIQVEEYERFSEVIAGKLQDIDGIEKTQTLMAFKTYKVSL